jgi:hypothetical protein
MEIELFVLRHVFNGKKECLLCNIVIFLHMFHRWILVMEVEVHMEKKTFFYLN